MTIKSAGDKLDDAIGGLAERVSRRLTRRAALKSAIVGSAAGIAAIALGQQPAMAALDCGPTVNCGYYGKTCPFAGCPSGYSLCKYPSCNYPNQNWQGYNCEYSSGYWVAGSGYGNCHNGYYLCYDCVGSGGCYDWCTCLSGLICGQCCTPSELKEEQKRLQQELAGA